MLFWGALPRERPSVYQGLLVRRFAPGVGDNDLNLVLLAPEGSAPGLSVMDDEGRLAP